MAPREYPPQRETVSLYLRISLDLKRELNELARDLGESINATAERLLAMALERRERP